MRARDGRATRKRLCWRENRASYGFLKEKSKAAGAVSWSPEFNQAVLWETELWQFLSP